MPRPGFAIDLHADTLMPIVHEGHHLDGPAAPIAQVDLDRLERGGVGAQVFAIFVTPYWQGARATARADALLDLLDAELARPGVRPRMAPARTAADITAVTGGGRIAALAGIEGAHVLDTDPGRIAPFAARGVRYLTLTWSQANAFGDSSGSAPVHEGLTAAGRELVRRCEENGVLVDLSHVHDRTLWDALDVARHPVIASHSSCRAIADHPRNLTDDQLRAIAATGGVIGINLHSAFLEPGWPASARVAPWRTSTDWPDPMAAESADRHSRTHESRPGAPLSRAVEHVLHALEVAGPDHVALGADFDGGIEPPAGLEDVAGMPALRAALAEAGVDDATLDQVWSVNVLRVLADADPRFLAATAGAG
ncbi:MAG: dipeptidase [Chloroflexota bacterium]